MPNFYVITSEEFGYYGYIPSNAKYYSMYLNFIFIITMLLTKYL